MSAPGREKEVRLEVKQSARGFGCPRCGAGFNSIYVVFSRSATREGIAYKRRTRGCKECKNVWSTYEVHRPDFERFLESKAAFDLLRNVLLGANR